MTTPHLGDDMTTKPTLNDLGHYPESEQDATADNMIRFVAVAAYAQHITMEIPPAGASEAQHRAYHEAIRAMINRFAIADLLHFLKDFHPDVADDAARSVWCAWEDGGVIPELLGDWLDDLKVDPDAVKKAAEAARETADRAVPA